MAGTLPPTIISATITKSEDNPEQPILLVLYCVPSDSPPPISGFNSAPPELSIPMLSRVDGAEEPQVTAKPKTNHSAGDSYWLAKWTLIPEGVLWFTDSFNGYSMSITVNKVEFPRYNPVVVQGF